MSWYSCFVCVSLLTLFRAALVMSATTKSGDKNLWKKVYEEELAEAMLSSLKKQDNHTRVRAHTDTGDNDAVIERLLDSLSSSDKYMKKVDAIDFRLNRLDMEIHEKTNNILKYLTEMMKVIRGQGVSEKINAAVEVLKKEFQEVKSVMDRKLRNDNKDNVFSGTKHAFNGYESSKVDNRLLEIDTNVKTVMTSAEKMQGMLALMQNCHNTLVRSENNINRENGCYETQSLVTDFRKSLMEIGSKKCDCSSAAKMNRYDRAERYPTDCYEIQMQGFNVSGIYKIKPDDMDSFYVLCDLSTAGGGWTVLQNRFDGSQDFFKKWWDYKHGFGNLAGEFWLGLEKMHYVTNQKLYELRIELETHRGHDAHAGYSVFTIGPEYEGYRISTLGTYYGNAGDSLTYHAGQKFSTMDVDNDDWKDGACATEHGGAWWYKECDKSNLNGKYSMPIEENVPTQSMYWVSFEGPNYPLSKTKMMIRPLPASRPAEYHIEHKPKIKKSDATQPYKMNEKKTVKYEPHLLQQFKYEPEAQPPQKADPYFASYP